MKARDLLAASALALLVLASWGQTPPVAAQAPLQVKLFEFAIEPKTLTLPAGERTLEAENTGTTDHNFTVEELGGRMLGEIANLAPRRKASLTLTLRPGRYAYFCAFHRDLGMEGTLIVTE